MGSIKEFFMDEQHRAKRGRISWQRKLADIDDACSEVLVDSAVSLAFVGSHISQSDVITYYYISQEFV